MRAIPQFQSKISRGLHRRVDISVENVNCSLHLRKWFSPERVRSLYAQTLFALLRKGKKKKKLLTRKTLETYIFRMLINVFAKGESDTIDRGEKQFARVSLESLDRWTGKNVQLRNYASRRRVAWKSNRSNGGKRLAVTENRNRLFQIRAPTYSPTHPPTTRASLSTSSLAKAKPEPAYPLLCKSTRLRRNARSATLLPPIFSFFSLDRSLSCVKRRRIDRTNVIIRWIANDKKETSNREMQLWIHRKIFEGILVLNATIETFRLTQPLRGRLDRFDRPHRIDRFSRNKNYGRI